MIFWKSPWPLYEEYKWNVSNREDQFQREGCQLDTQA